MFVILFDVGWWRIDEWVNNMWSAVGCSPQCLTVLQCWNLKFDSQVKWKACLYFFVLSGFIFFPFKVHYVQILSWWHPKIIKLHSKLYNVNCSLVNIVTNDTEYTLTHKRVVLHYEAPGDVLYCQSWNKEIVLLDCCYLESVLSVQKILIVKIN